MTPRFYLSGEIGLDMATGAAVGLFCDANPGAVEIVINSAGGIASEGAAIFAALERHGNATAVVQGIAASAASLAMLGALRVHIHDAALLMIHEPGMWAMGAAQDMRAAADTLDKLTVTYAAIYSRATGNPLERVKSWMADETWLTAEEAVALNFADEVIGGETARPIAVAAFDYQKFRTAPHHLVAMALQNGWVTASPDQTEKDKR